MNIALWILQFLLALVFLIIGLCKTLIPGKKLVAMGQTGVEGLAPWVIKFIGISEILASFGLVLPRALEICPLLTPVAAACLGIIMVLASVVHYKRYIR
ncbi:MAG TPA: DoxX family protein, partial [Segetibacter sp.]|nr:DoxX family protein [Segetibacter sp.]